MTEQKNTTDKIDVDEKDAKISDERPRESLYREPNAKGSSESVNSTKSNCPANWGDG